MSALDQDVRPGRTRAVGRPPRGRDVGRTLVRGTGQTLLTVGLVALLFVGYELWVTDLLAAREQDRLTEQIRDDWAEDPTVGGPGPVAAAPPPGDAPAPAPPEVLDVAVGEPFAVLHIPRLGADYERVVVEGTAQTQLAQGPGHYLRTAMPGEQGNLALAGHRVGRGSPFLDLDRLRPGDPIVVETAGTWFVYRVLGAPGDQDFAGDPSGIPGRRIVRPTDVTVLSPTPGGPAGGPATGAFLTLTTCHPKYSAEQRLVIHARLDGEPVSRATAPDGPPALLG
ncbi:class E sortase [Blastococcus saxobsidens]|uniref:Class E sortase n=1 Tax=Blastococcus saxobsidens TaxID=138336 RepID=A0A6L9W084_9ACTN|nr:class E sortase [Blastococcus saxobsidens]NEK84840.1 class E sortase [Blastococcus saxobsidens]